ncbi:MAG TPA: PepSY domain-containing protein [Devosia sp.]|nr:PepSY domain-containing protein [Devosia sp.]
MKQPLAILVCLAMLPVGIALADDNSCRVSGEQMQSWQAVVQLADSYMWTIDSMKIDDGCYKLKITDPGGNSIKAKIDPASLDVIDAKVERFANERGGQKPAVASAN